jgi:hypothetical protein
LIAGGALLAHSLFLKAPLAWYDYSLDQPEFPCFGTFLQNKKLTTLSSMLIKSSWAVLALIHVLPALALFRPALLNTLYGAQEGTPTYLLLHHRAALFAGVFVACVWAVFRPEARQLAVMVVGTSMLSFLVLYALAGMPEGLKVIAIADTLGLPFLALVAWQAFGSVRP